MNNREPSSPDAMIEHTRRRVQNTRNVYYDRSMDGGISRQLHKELVRRVLEYFDVLFEFRNEPSLDEGDFPDVSPILDRLGEQTSVITTAPGRGRGETRKYLPAVLEIPPARLVEITEQLDDLAQKLGFGAESRPPDIVDEISLDDLEDAFGRRDV